MKAGDHVKVDFVSESATIYSGKRFTGYGVLGRVEDGRVYGRLDDGTPFMCLCADVEVIGMSDFEKYIEAKYPNRSPKILFQKFKDIDGTLFYRIKEVEDQAEAWNHQQAIIDNLKTQLNNMEACYIEKKKQVEAVSQVLCELKESLKDFQEMDLYDKGHRVTTEYVIADLKQALRGDND